MSEKRQEIRERDIQGLKYLDLLLPMLGRLHFRGLPRGFNVDSRPRRPAIRFVPRSLASGVPR